MSKRDKPPFWVRIDHNKLAPLTEYDERKILSYKNGAELRVSFWQGRSLPELRKYWAILDLVIERCNTPWSTPEEASDALKLELGITDVSKTVHGQWFVRPGSIAFTEMEESAFLDFRSKAFAVLEALTGVDPWTLQKEAANTELPGGRELNPDSDVPPSSEQDKAETDTVASRSVSAGEGESPTPPGSPSPDIQSAEDGDVSADGGDGDDLTGNPPSPSDEIDPRFKEAVRQLLAVPLMDALLEDQLSKLTELKDFWKGNLKKDCHDKLAALFRTTQAILKGRETRQRALEYYTGVLKCGVIDLEPDNG